jgi:hypothetical protein
VSLDTGLLTVEDSERMGDEIRDEAGRWRLRAQAQLRYPSMLDSICATISAKRS